MYLAVDPQPTCATAWLAATERVNRCKGHETSNVIINVANPVIMTDVDKAIIAKIDALLDANGAYPVRTVANTIFPQALYDRFGRPEFYDVYLKHVWERIKTGTDWGRYFERMISFPIPKKNKPLNPLEEIILKMKSKVEGTRCYMNVYELTIFDPIRDAGRDTNRQCLSFLSFQLTDENPRRLMLTAMYRNHYYIERLLGNLIGLGRLMRFVANEVGVEVGELTILSHHALVDTADGLRPPIYELISDCRAIVDNSLASEPA
jgi:hypothetical protein